MGVAHTVFVGCGAHGIFWVWRTRYFLVSGAHDIFWERRTRYFFWAPWGPGRPWGPNLWGMTPATPAGGPSIQIHMTTTALLKFIMYGFLGPSFIFSIPRVCYHTVVLVQTLVLLLGPRRSIVPERTRGATAPLHNAYRDRHPAATQKSNHCRRSGGKAQSSKEKSLRIMKSSKHKGGYIYLYSCLYI